MTTSIQTPAAPPFTHPPADPADGSARVLVRSNMPVELRPHAGIGGSPKENCIGALLLAEAIRANLGLPCGSVLEMGEFHQCCILINCGAIPAAQVVPTLLALLTRLEIEYAFSISSLSLGYGFFRSHHHGLASGPADELTFDDFKRIMGDCIKADEKRMELRTWLAGPIAALIKKTPPPENKPPGPSPN